MKRQARFLLWAAAAVFCFGAAVVQDGKVQKYRQSCGFYFANPVSGQSLSSFFEGKQEKKEQDVRAAAWRNETAVYENPDTGRKAQGELYCILGNTELLFWGRLCGGSYALADDRAGCMVSRELAEELFGTEKVAGEKVCLFEKSYAVRGVIKGSGRFAAISGRLDEEYTGITVKNEKKERTASAVKNLVYERTGMVPDVFAEGGLYGALSRAACMLPLWVGLFLTVRYFRMVLRKKLGFWGGLLPLLLGVFGVWKLSCRTFLFSADYLPAMWSDFSFWMGLFQEKSADFRKLADWVLAPGDREMLACMKHTVYFAAGSCVCLGFAWVMNKSDFWGDTFYIKRQSRGKEKIRCRQKEKC